MWRGLGTVARRVGSSKSVRQLMDFGPSAGRRYLSYPAYPSYLPQATRRVAAAAGEVGNYPAYPG
jgi:hypothetical protein